MNAELAELNSDFLKSECGKLYTEIISWAKKSNPYLYIWGELEPYMYNYTISENPPPNPEFKNTHFVLEFFKNEMKHQIFFKFEKDEKIKLNMSSIIHRESKPGDEGTNCLNLSNPQCEFKKTIEINEEAK